jgi:uncharacterized membrane protein
MNVSSDRPRLSLPYAPLEVALEVLSAAGVLALLYLTWQSWPTLPARIPTHFNAVGLPDGWGGKGSLLFLPILGLLLYGMTVLSSRMPHALNYPVPVTQENAPRLYRIARWLLALLKLLIMAMLLFLEVSMIRVAQGKATGLGVLPMPFFLAAIALTLIVGILQMYRAK